MGSGPRAPTSTSWCRSPASTNGPRPRRSSSRTAGRPPSRSRCRWVADRSWSRATRGSTSTSTTTRSCSRAGWLSGDRSSRWRIRDGPGGGAAGGIRRSEDDRRGCGRSARHRTTAADHRRRPLSWARIRRVGRWLDGVDAKPPASSSSSPDRRSRTRPPGWSSSSWQPPSWPRPTSASGASWSSSCCTRPTPISGC